MALTVKFTEFYNVVKVAVCTFFLKNERGVNYGDGLNRENTICNKAGYTAQDAHFSPSKITGDGPTD